MMKPKTKIRVFVTKISNPKPGLYMFWYQIGGGRPKIERGNQKQMIANRQEILNRYKDEDLKLGS